MYLLLVVGVLGGAGWVVYCFGFLLFFLKKEWLYPSTRVMLNGMVR